MQQLCPGAVSAFFMGYLQNEPDTGQAMSPAAAGEATTQLPSTRASVLPAGDGGRAVPAITFLYRLTPGIADRSFGLNVARLARLPPAVIAHAADQAAAMEEAAAERSNVGSRTSHAADSLLRQLQHAVQTGLDQPALVALQEQARAALH